LRCEGTLRDVQIIDTPRKRLRFWYKYVADEEGEKKLDQGVERGT